MTCSTTPAHQQLCTMEDGDRSALTAAAATYRTDAEVLQRGYRQGLARGHV